MPNLQNRTRVLYVRVSDREFRRLKDLCRENGARNMSELVRSSMDSMSRVGDGTFEHEVKQRLQQVENALDDLRKTMAMIADGRTA